MDKTSSFMELTGTTDKGLAEFYLSSAGGDVNKAVNIYLESVKGSSKIATLSGNSKNTNTFFAGGEKSGVLLQGKPDKSDDKSDLVRDIVNLASQSQPFDDEPSSSGSKFRGNGYKLNSSTSETSQREVEKEEDEIATRTLTFWRNGFSIDDGPLRDFNDPENEAFLNAIKKGMAPLNYLNLKPGQRVELKIAHRSNEDYEAPKSVMKPFSGVGQRLGSIVPGNSALSPPVASQPTSSLKFQVNENEPMTSVQIRLGDGTRLVLKCNHSHTIGDVRNFIVASRPGESSRTWILQTAHPVQNLVDLNQTIKDAGLLNSVIIQRYT